MQIMEARKGRFYAIPAPERDRLIVELRNKGWTNARIGKRVGMTESGVRSSIARIRDGGFGNGQAPRR
jgi:DNA-binding NarL/FixJ family response regulator